MEYKKYKNTIRNVAWKISKKYNYDYEELESEGNVIFVEAINRYKK
jgi:DNA-directed RNA polymerase specialized sigma subunit